MPSSCSAPCQAIWRSNSIPNLYVLLPAWGWLGMSVLLYIFLAGSAWFLMQVVGKITNAQQSGMHLSQSDVFA